MNTSDVSLLPSQAPTSPWPMKMKLGPHLDLLETCDFTENFEPEYQDKQTHKNRQIHVGKTVGMLLQKALAAQALHERVSAAREAIEASNGTCGLAWLVLAREGVNSPESAMIYSQRAIDRIKQELHSNNFTDYCIYSYTYTVALADAAEMAFVAGQRDDAIAMLKEQLEKDFSLDDNLWSDCQIILRDQLACLLIQMGAAKEAQALLHSQPDNIESWHYLNALTHYTIGGDCLESRSALACAFRAGTKTVQKLLGGSSEIELANDQFDQAICIEKAVCAWQSNEEATEWLKEIFKHPHSLPSRESMTIAVHGKDKKRWELWDSRETSAAYFMDTDSYKEAGKEFKAALREAERIDYSYFPFLNTMTGLIALDPKPVLVQELRLKLDERVIRFNGLAQDNLAALHLQSFATLYHELGDLNAASHYQSKALEVVRAELESQPSPLTLSEAAEICQALAEILYELNRYPEALMYCQQGLAMQERYLGSTHFDELPALELAHDCCQQMGDIGGTAALSDKMKAIDPFAFG